MAKALAWLGVLQVKEKDDVHLYSYLDLMYDKSSATYCCG